MPQRTRVAFCGFSKLECVFFKVVQCESNRKNGAANDLFSAF